jgi:DNA repair protein RecN (Recombination protein N)
MLVGILLTNFAIAKKIELSFNSNLVLITGETGTGKTIIMKGLSAACGGSVSSEVIRSNSEKAQVEASFTLSNTEKTREILKEFDLLDDDSVVILTRTIFKNRTKAGLNGHFVPIKILEKVGRSLIDMHGQHEVQSLLNVENHINILDRFGGKDLIFLRDKVGKEVQELKSLNSKIAELKEQDRKYREERDFINFEIEELKKADLRKDEEEELKKEERVLSNSQELTRLINESRILISQSENRSILDLLDELLGDIEKASIISDNFSGIAQRIETLRSEISDIDRELSDFSEDNLFDPVRLNEIEERLSFISTLKMKYRKSVPELIDYLAELEERSNSFSSLNNQIEFLENKRTALLGELKDDVLLLSEERKRVAESFRKSVLLELKDLAMENADFKVSIRNIEDSNGIKIEDKIFKLFSYGIDSVRFMIAPNPGEGFKDLASIASGGELSRVMLAIKKVIAAVDEIPTLAFDEVDAGIGGKTGEKVAEKLLEISKFRQVICITHLPQIASLPGEHLVIEKEVKGKETFLTVRKLGEKGRINEIARMISGSNITETTLKQAEELLRRWV